MIEARHSHRVIDADAKPEGVNAYQSIQSAIASCGVRGLGPQERRLIARWIVHCLQDDGFTIVDASSLASPVVARCLVGRDAR